MLLKGLAGFRSEVRQEAMYVLGLRVFGSTKLERHEKRRAFRLTLKKILALTGESSGDELTFYYRCALLGRMCRFLTEQELLYGGFHFEEPRPIAFFPGTFDPFTLSHKGIAQAILDLGYEVMLAIDEFSWSKKTQPHRLRRHLAAISVADEFHVHIFPENFPVNIASPQSLTALREAFPGRTVAIVAGSDVVANASAYRQAPTPGSIHSFDHIIFHRAAAPEVDYSAITGKVTQLHLPQHLEEISSTRIRDAIEEISVASPTTYARYCGHPQGVIYGYETADWDSLMPRMMMMKEDAALFPGLRFAGGYAMRSSGYSSSYVSGDLSGRQTVGDLKREVK